MKRTRVIIAFFCLLAIFWFAGLFIFVQSAIFAPTPQPLQKLDAIVALTGGSNRLDTGFELLKKGLGKKLFISGVARGVEVKSLLKRWKDEPQSNLDCCVVLGFEADNTAGNAIETIEWLKKENFHSLYLVTANYHMKRALLEFKNISPNLNIVPFPVVPEKIDMNSWWKESSIRNLIVREYMKYVAAYVLQVWRRFK